MFYHIFIYYIMKLIWYIISFFVILFILINNPKSSSIGNLANQGQLLNSTRRTEKKLQFITIVFIMSFFILTILNSVYL